MKVIHTLMSRANVKKASSTLMEALAEVSMNLIPYSIANCSPLSLETWNRNYYFLLFFVLRVGDCCGGHFMELKTTKVPVVSNLSKVEIKGEWFKVFSVQSPVFGHSCHTYFQESSSPHPHWHAPQYSGSSS